MYLYVMKRRAQLIYTLTAMLLLLTSLMGCDKEYSCNCYQDVMGIDTTFNLVGEGRDPKTTCDAFDSETTEFGITKTVDCEPY